MVELCRPKRPVDIGLPLWVMPFAVIAGLKCNVCEPLRRSKHAKKINKDQMSIWLARAQCGGR